MLSLGKLSILAFICSLFAYGIDVFVYFICGLLSFAAGFLLYLPKVHWVTLKRKIPISHGLVEINDKKANMSHLKVNYAISGCHELDVVLNQILDNIINDYVRRWYTSLTNEPEFPQQLHAAIAQLMTEVSKRAQRIDWVPFMIEGIPNRVIEHLRIHRRSLEKYARSSNSVDPIKFFFDEEMEAEMQICREQVCISREKELDHFRRITDVFLFAIMPEEDYRLLTVRYLLKEILVNGVLLPTVNILADPDFVNQSIIKLCNESAFASPYFIQSLRMSTREDELKTVKERIEVFAVKLRGRDSGGDDDTMVKAQLNSLNYLENVCNLQIAEIKRGIPRKSDQRVSSANLHSDCLGQTSTDVTFADVMGNDVAVSHFLEFLTSINEQSLLSLYLNCIAYRVNSEELMSSITSVPSTNEPEGDVFGSNSGWDETKTAELDQTLQQEGELQEQPEISEEDREATNRIREFGVSMCNLVMRTLPQIPEETLKRCLKALSASMDTIDPNVFIEVEEELIRLLSSERCFGAFKRSPYYARAVEVFKSSPDMFLESPRPPGANGGDDVKETPPYSSQSASSSPVFSRAASAVSVPPSSYSPQGSQTHLNSPPSSTSFFPHSYTANVLSGEMVREGYVVYTLEVTCLSTITGRRSTWRTHRRYSQFDDLHSLIVEQCGRIPNLKLPAKKSFSSVSSEFIEKRRSDLDDYLQILCGIDTTGRYPKLHPILSNFLQPEKWERKKGAYSLMNPFKAVGSAIISVPDTLFDGFSRMLNRRQPTDRLDVISNVSAPVVSSNSMVSRPSLIHDSSSLAIFDQTDSDNIPFRLLFMLVDEIFSLQRKTQLFRRGTLAILRNIVQTFFGDIMNRRIVEKAKNLISAKQLAAYAAILRDVLWPNGSQGQPNGGVSKSAAPENSSVRDEAMKLRTRVLCRAVMFGSVAEELASYLGHETTREGVQRVFDLLQQPCLNRRLVHCLLEGITRLLLADQAAQLNKIYAQDFSRHSN